MPTGGLALMAAEPNRRRGQPKPSPSPARRTAKRRDLKAVPDAKGPAAAPAASAAPVDATIGDAAAGGSGSAARLQRRAAASSARERSRERQRLRLAAAMIECVAESGYRSTRVADVIVRAGVSRKTFYEHFANKEECLLVTYDYIAGEGMRRVESAYAQAEGWPGRAEAAIGALFGAAIANPGAMQLSLIEITSVGPAGIERRRQTIKRYQSFIRDALADAPGSGAVADVALQAIVGGLNRALYRRVLRGDGEQLQALVPDLAAWATSYHPSPPAILAEPKALSRAERAAIEMQSGRAPGTLAPHPVLGGRRGLARGDRNVSRSFVVQNQRARILDAATNLTARDGYAALGVEAIAEQAAVSLVAFYEHFVDKEDAFLVAYEVGHGKAMAAVERAYASQSNWRLAVRAGIEALFNFLASEPSFAHIALIDALTATPHTAERSKEGVGAFAQMLVPGLDETRGFTPPAITVEAIAGGVFDLCLQYALAGRIGELPELVPSATYVALAPFLGGAEAARIATAQRRPRRGADAPAAS
jgi:AcrR family transcriptional regulator